MRSVFWSVLGLTALYVALQTGASNNIAWGANIATVVFGGLSDPTVAGIRESTSASKAAAGGSGGGSTDQHALTNPNPAGGTGPVLQV